MFNFRHLVPIYNFCLLNSHSIIAFPLLSEFDRTRIKSVLSYVKSLISLCGNKIDITKENGQIRVNPGVGISYKNVRAFMWPIKAKVA